MSPPIAMGDHSETMYEPTNIINCNCLVMLAIISVANLLAICLVTNTTTAAAEPTIEYDELSTHVARRCNDFDSIRNLTAFVNFHAKYAKLNRECLHSDKLLSSNSDRKPLASCLAAEETCQQNGILFSIVDELNELIGQFVKLELPVCTIEYAGRLVRIHNQLTMTEWDNESKTRSKLLPILSSLANQVATKCRSCLNARLLFIEQHFPNAKTLSLVINLLNIGQQVGQIPVEPEHHAPIFEHELKQAVSLGRDPSVFEFELPPAVKMTLDAIKVACALLKPFQLNTSGSLGLLASSGYLASPSKVRSLDGGQEAADAVLRIRRWTLSAILCQSMGGVQKMADDSSHTSRLVILPSLEADIHVGGSTMRTSDADHDQSELELPEPKDPIDLSVEIVRGTSNDDGEETRATGELRKQNNLRKLELINGPSYKLANAIQAYLDLTQNKDRVNIAYDMLGL